MKRHFPFAAIILLLASVIPSLAVSHAILWDAANGRRDLGSLGTDSYAFGINDSGTVIGYYIPVDKFYQHGFVWTEATGMVDIGIPGGGDSTTAVCFPTAINSAGNVVGYGRQVDGRQVAFFWSPTNGFTVLGDYSGDGDSGNAAYAINDHDLVTGNLLTSNSEFDYHAFVWSPEMTHPRDIGTYGGQGSSTGFGINNRGRIVGSAVKTGDIFGLTVWSQQTGWRLFGMITDSLFVETTGINDAGQIIGFEQTGTSELAFFFGQPGGLRFLQGIGGDATYPLAINHLGVIAGLAFDAAGDDHAVMWSTPTSKPTVLPFDAAFGLNNVGQIVGWAGVR